jgi:hypothetical protein
MPRLRSTQQALGAAAHRIESDNPSSQTPKAVEP